MWRNGFFLLQIISFLGISPTKVKNTPCFWACLGISKTVAHPGLYPVLHLVTAAPSLPVLLWCHLIRTTFIYYLTPIFLALVFLTFTQSSFFSICFIWGLRVWGSEFVRHCRSEIVRGKVRNCLKLPLNLIDTLKGLEFVGYCGSEIVRH